VSGCGSSGDEKSPTEERAEQPRAPLMVRELHREFPPPQAAPGVKGSAAAIRAGEAACAGRTPVEVTERYLPIALERGSLQAGSLQAKMIAEVGRYAKNIETEASFTAGQLAADAYQATLPRRLQKSGYQACIHSLAKQLEDRLYSK
jgi:hypothetical protein